jgi:hypothetical protein
MGHPTETGLFSTAHDHEWDVVEHAICQLPVPRQWVPRHDAPFAECQCGLYAWYRPDSTSIVPADVFGVIEATGRVLLGDRGFRAERARLLAVVDTGDDGYRARFARLGIAVLPNREALLAEYPPDDVSELLGHEPDETPFGVASEWAAAVASLQAAASQIGKLMEEFGKILQRATRALM